jgi:hypothetical protein
MKIIKQENQLKALLEKKMDQFITELEAKGLRGELGILSENLEIHMAEAAYLILKQNVDTEESISPSN